MLANEGYVVLELGYNVPKFGQRNFFSHTDDDPFDLQYIRSVIDKLLAHPKVYGDKICIMGQSKGAELASAAAALMPEVIELGYG